MARALTKRGHEALLWYGADLPERQSMSLAIDPSGALDFEFARREWDRCDAGMW